MEGLRSAVRWLSGSQKPRIWPNAAAPHVALVDLANVCPTRGEQDHIDALFLTAELVRSACKRTLLPAGSVMDVECRFYGGFRDVNGKPTEQRVWLAKHVAKIRGLEDRVRLLPTIVETIVAAPGPAFVGTYNNKRQVMVDGMIAEDLGAYARAAQYASIVLVTDDDDFVPSVLSANRASPTLIRWIRLRATARNDYLLRGATEFLTDARWHN